MGLQSPSERYSNVSVGSNVVKALTRYCGWTPVHGGDADASLLSLSCLINKKTRTKRV